MNDPMNPLVQFSPYAGKLTEIEVPGVTSHKADFENDVAAASGESRTMWCYAPVSGCPDAKQTQVLFVFRDDSSRESAEKLLAGLGLEKLAEEEHFLILFPNPRPSGWSARIEFEHENDMDYVVRCFGFLRESPLRVNGFNGMLYYLATTPASSAFLSDMIALHPAFVSAAMVTELPAGYAIPEGALGVETAAWCTPGPMREYLLKANAQQDAGIDEESGMFGQNACAEPYAYMGKNQDVRLFVSPEEMDADLVRKAWDVLFSRSRRWQNDTYGSYHHRIAFSKVGFEAHVEDSSLGVNNGFPHTWYEYVPPRLRELRREGSICEITTAVEKNIPLVFYFHGINCVPLYGAEQSLWQDIADREGLIVVFPAPARYKAWNIYDLPVLPSDINYILALLSYMKRKYPIDESRVYLSGFSMGSAMTHALSSVYPEKFAAAACFNAFSFSRFIDPYANLSPFLRDLSEEMIGHVSYTTQYADRKRAERPELRMPIFQCAGMEDGLIATWPCTEADEKTGADVRMKTLNWWKDFNHISERGFDPSTLSGLMADENFWQDEEQRYWHQRWYGTGKEEGSVPLLELVLAKRMAHAIDPVEVEWAWAFMRQFSRNEDGTLRFVKRGA